MLSKPTVRKVTVAGLSVILMAKSGVLAGTPMADLTFIMILGEAVTEIVQELQERVWPVATHWAPSRQAASLPSEVEALWSKRGYGGVAAEGGFGDGSAAHVALGGRLQAAAAAAATACHFDGDSGHARAQAHPHRTVLHGDAKAIGI